MKQTKGYKHGRKSKKRQAYEAIQHAGTHAFNHRKKKKRDFRRAWQRVINYAVRPFGLSYSKFIHQLKENNVGLNRKMLAELAQDAPEVFEEIVEEVKK